MDAITTQKARIRTFLNQAGAKKSDLARAAGLPATTLTGVEGNEWNPRSSTLSALVRALDQLNAEAQPPQAA